MKSLLRTVVLSACLVAAAAAQQSSSSGSSSSQRDHEAALKSHGDHAMGFSQDKSTHHFYLFADGGMIQVEASSAKDAETKNQIQMHLNHIAQMFADGNFKIPMFVHDEVPPGVPVLQQKKTDIVYKFEKTEFGGRVRVTTKNAEALHAVHDFLRYQITDHKTGDSLEVSTTK